ncbi:hypothetical protein ABC347_01950 [Sphingomonas sp. 1P06PA]|uniref:hypothetical protein n=1 Tax=Sphingomonas sp. 1P06PA TaxID=554121 RepID=UPI0039A63398
MIAVAVSVLGTAELAAAMPSGHEAIAAAASCVIRAEPDRSIARVSVIPGTVQEDALLAALEPAFQRCSVDAGVAVRGNWVALDGQLAEDLYRRAIARRRATPVDQVEAGDALPGAILSQMQDWPRDSATVACAVALDPGAADRLIRTGRGTDDEARAIMPIRTILPRCLPVGQQLAIFPMALRGEVARALYRDVSDLIDIVQGRTAASR